ncbi:MarR family transcriptional regulator [bacterium]|jgi:homoprotocatechuate degradation regulator HpaR|nr:MarR family transcriptional regulator [bacterium]|tara:strand:- start:1606 stop:2064 length:459 start_codon:yes stop_codon:yes gene_type:complete
MNYSSINEKTIDFTLSLPMLLNRSLDAIMPPYRDLFQEFGVTEQQWRVLRVLWEQKHLTSAQISNLTLLPSPSLVGILDRLERKGLVKRLRSTSDRREINITITNLGRELQSKVMPKVKLIQDQTREKLSPTEWKQINNILKKLDRIKIEEA